MALATRCPYCHTTFRVASDQLKLRGGIVRCGACQRIFDGQAHLVDLDAVAAARQADAPASPTDGSVAVADAAAPPLSVVPEPPPGDATGHAIEDHDRPVYTLDFNHTLDPLGILPVAGQAGDDPAAVADDGAEVDDLPPAPDVAEAVPSDADVVSPDAHVDRGTPPPWPAGDAPDAIPAPDTLRTQPVHADAPAQVDARAETDAAPTQADADADARARVGATPAPAEPIPGDDASARMTAAHDAALPDAAAAPDHTSVARDADADERTDTPPAPDAAPDAAPSAVAGDLQSPPARIEPSFGLPVDEELVARPLPDAAPDPNLDPNLDLNLTLDVTDGHDREASPPDAPPPQPVPPADAAPHASAQVALPLRASADPAPASPTRVEPTLDAPTSARARSAEARARRSALTPTRIEAPRLRVPATAPADEPEFVKRSRRRERSGKTVKTLLALGAVVLLLLLAAQLVLDFRNELAARSPSLRPALAAACVPLGCRVDWPAHAENLVIDEGDLAPIGQDAYALNTALHNQGNVTQAWPSIELELVDAGRKPVLRRVFGPAEYLPPGTRPDAGFGARSELPVKLNFALAGVKPSSYNIVVFYP